MKIGDKLLKQLGKKYPASDMIHFKFERYDAAVKTDESGNAIVLFIGKVGMDLSRGIATPGF